MPKILAGHVFVFFGNNRTRIKLLFFDGTGLVLLAKRLEQGRFMWVRDLEVERVSFAELEQLLHGSVLVKSKLGVIPKKKILPEEIRYVEVELPIEKVVELAKEDEVVKIYPVVIYYPTLDESGNSAAAALVSSTARGTPSSAAPSR